MDGESSAQLLKRVSEMISRMNELADKARMGRMSKTFAKDQAHGFARDINSGLRDITEGMKNGKVLRFEGLLVAAKCRKALEEIKKAGFLDESENPA